MVSLGQAGNHVMYTSCSARRFDVLLGGPGLGIKEIVHKRVVEKNRAVKMLVSDFETCMRRHEFRESL